MEHRKMMRDHGTYQHPPRERTAKVEKTSRGESCHPDSNDTDTQHTQKVAEINAKQSMFKYVAIQKKPALGCLGH